MAETTHVRLSSYDIVKEGWLQKKRLHFKTWTDRYFCLLKDGKFYGFKEKPPKFCEVKICNRFSVIDARLSSEYDNKYYYMNLRCFQVENSKPVQRIFGFTSIQERDEWLDAIRKISRIHRANDDQAVDSSKDNVDLFIKSSSVRTIKDYKLHKVLGEGTFGRVILCSDIITQEIFAIKGICKKVVEYHNYTSHVFEEAKVLKSVSHPFLTRMKCCFEDDETIYFVMEFVQGGEIFYHLNDPKNFSENRTRLYVAEITLALEYLHSKDIIYRDLKLENIMLDDEGHIKLTDFGLCKTDVSRKLAKTFCGTPEYLAPEFAKQSNYGMEVDWWSLGVVCYEMLTGTPPIAQSADCSVEEILENIQNAQIGFKIEWKKKISPTAQNFTLSLLMKDPSQRLGCRSKGGAESIKNHTFFRNIDWNDVLKKNIIPEFIPEVKGKLDTSQFCTSFTKKTPDFKFDLSGLQLDDNTNSNDGKVSKNIFEMNM